MSSIRQVLPDCAIEWALYQLRDANRTRRDVADQLQIDRRTLDRRLAELPVPRMMRCQECSALTRETRCANGHQVFEPMRS